MVNQLQLDRSDSPSLELKASEQFNAWLFQQNISIAFTTYQAGKILFLGLQADGQLSLFERTFGRSMGLWANGNSLYLSSRYQLWRFENALAPGQNYNGYDALFIPQTAYTTSDLHIHDLVQVDRQGEKYVVFVNTLFNCLATVSNQHSFIPLWKPAFISQLVAEDRCHLNGVALREGQARYVTAVSQTNSANGWREHRADGGCVIDVPSNEIIMTGLSMPHSPRWYQNRLWLLNAGTGEFGYVDEQQGKFEPVTFCPGYLRGLAFSGDFAIIGLSKIRGESVFSGLPLDEKLQANNGQALCGLAVVDLQSGNTVHFLSLEGAVSELYDVALLPGVRRPMALGLKTEEIEQMVTIGP